MGPHHARGAPVGIARSEERDAAADVRLESDPAGAISADVAIGQKLGFAPYNGYIPEQQWNETLEWLTEGGTDYIVSRRREMAV